MNLGWAEDLETDCSSTPSKPEKNKKTRKKSKCLIGVCGRLHVCVTRKKESVRANEFFLRQQFNLCAKFMASFHVYESKSAFYTQTRAENFELVFNFELLDYRRKSVLSKINAYRVNRGDVK